MLSIESNLLTDPGLKRQNNEDFVVSHEPNKLEVLQASGCLYLVADGVGGASSGELASRHACERVLSAYYQNPQESPGVRLVNAIRLANQEIYAAAERNTKRFATTLTAAIIHQDTLTIAHVGDSRAYLIRNGEARQLTQDHTEAAEMVQKGMLSEEEARHSKSRNQLARAVGAEQDIQVDLGEGIPLLTGDRIVLCTDGLTRYASDEAAAAQDLVRLATPGTTAEAAQRLVQYANQMGGVDNVSVIVISIGQPLRMTTSQATMPPTRQVRDEDGEDTLSDRFKAHSTASQTGPTLRDYAPWIAGGIVLFVLSVFIGLFLGRMLLKSEPSQTVLPPEVVSLTQTALNLPASPAATTPAGEAAPTSQALPTQTAAAAGPMPSDTPTTPSAVPLDLPALTPSATQETQTACVYLTKENDMLIPVLTQFDLTYIATNQYYRFESCEKTGSGLLCSGQVEILPHNVIQSGWWINISDQTKTDCLENGGEWASTQ